MKLSARPASCRAIPIWPGRRSVFTRRRPHRWPGSQAIGRPVASVASVRMSPPCMMRERNCVPYCGRSPGNRQAKPAGKYLLGISGALAGPTRPPGSSPGCQPEWLAAAWARLQPPPPNRGKTRPFAHPVRRILRCFGQKPPFFPRFRRVFGSCPLRSPGWRSLRLASRPGVTQASVASFSGSMARREPILAFPCFSAGKAAWR